MKRVPYSLLLAVFSFWTTFLNAQSQDIKAIKALLDSSTNYMNSQKPLIQKYYADSALSWSKRINYKLGILRSHNEVGNALMSQEKYEDALKSFEAAFLYSNQVKDEKAVANVISNLALAQNKLGDYTNSVKNNLKALQLREKIGDKKDIIASLQNIGVVYYYINDNNSIKVTLRAIEIAKTMNDPLLLATLYDNAGSIYFATYKDDSAIVNYMRAKELYDKHGTAKNTAAINNNIAVYYNGINQPKKALDFIRTCWKNLSSSDKEGNAGIDYCLTIGNCFTGLKNTDSALYYFKKAEHIARKLKLRYQVNAVYKYYMDLYTLKGDYKMALEYSLKSAALRDSLVGEKSLEKIAEFETLYKTDQQAGEIKLLNANSILEREKSKGAMRMLWFVSIALILVLGFVFLLFKNYRQKKRDNQLLNQKNEEIYFKSMVIEQKQKEILDSIAYAKRIQDAYLPTELAFQTILPSAFLLFKPKDVVSGDFYWFYNLRNNQNQLSDTVMVAVADCTGHGVPGALMSVVCGNALNEAVVNQKMEDTSLILDEARKIIIRNLKSKAGSGQKDGMDIALIKWNKTTNQIWYSGANNPLWIVKQDGTFLELKADKQPVGIYEKQNPFSTQTLHLQKGDKIFLFSDGYADQFGLSAEARAKADAIINNFNSTTEEINFAKASLIKGKKYKYTTLQNELCQNRHLDAIALKNKLYQTFVDWKGNLEQIDDVCIMGIYV